jgi:hypothetical protein
MNHLLRILAVLVVLCATGAAQEKIQRFEAGADFTYLRLHTPSSIAGNRLGIGGRFSFNINETFAIDSEWSNSLSEQPILFTGEFTGGRSNEIFAGVKAGGRGRRFGIFMKLRPGLITAGNVAKIISPGPVTFLTVKMGRRIDPLLDAGGVFEFYLSKRWILRYDVSDTIIFYGDGVRFVNFPPPFPTDARVSGSSTQNLRITAGVSYRF